MTRVVCPYAGDGSPQTTTRAALDEQAPHVEYVDVSASPTSYYELIVGLWRDAEDFLLVEHDVVLAPGTVEALEACPAPWCSCPASDWLAPSWHASFLQCNRIRGEVMRDIPHALDGIAPVNRHWCDVADYFLANAQATPHIHRDLPTRHHGTPRTRELFAYRRALSTEWACRSYSVEAYLAATVDHNERARRIHAVQVMRDLTATTIDLTATTIDGGETSTRVDVDAMARMIAADQRAAEGTR